jgi:hypothetical protein
MFYVIPDTLLKVSLINNKTGHHMFNDTFNNVSGITYNMVTSFNDTFNNVSGITW